MSTLDIPFEQAQTVADHLRARAEVHQAKPVGLVLLGTLSILSLVFREAAGPTWFAFYAMALLAGPFALRLLLPGGTRYTYRLSLVSPILNAILLAFICYLEIAKLPPLELTDLPTLQRLIPGLALVLPALYLAASFPWWLRHWTQQAEVLHSLGQPMPPEGLDRIELAVRSMLNQEPGPEDPVAVFRTVPPNPKDLKRFLRPDFTRHGEWRVLLQPDWALIIAADGTRSEAVARGSLRLVTDDLENQGRRILCLVRWNQHLHEGRIEPKHARVLLAWIKGTQDSAES